MMKCKCGYQTDNKKSYSNHVRYGCPVETKLTDEPCKQCGKKRPLKKPSEQGPFCGRKCYMAWRRIHIKGKNAPCYKTGESRTRLYRTWLSMRARCTKKHLRDYKNYGGRGIKICNEWLNDFMVFKDWAMKSGYTDDLTIERIDVNGNYEPQNCTWITHAEQAKNKRNTKNGKDKKIQSKTS